MMNARASDSKVLRKWRHASRRSSGSTAYGTLASGAIDRGTASPIDELILEPSEIAA